MWQSFYNATKTKTRNIYLFKVNNRKTEKVEKYLQS